MLSAGDVYRVEIPGEKTDHYWIMVTGVDKSGRVAYAMLTDARNLDFPQVVLPRGTAAWAGHTLSKDTAVDPARANIREAASLEQTLRYSGVYQEHGSAKGLSPDAVRDALVAAPETPPAMRRMPFEGLAPGSIAEEAGTPRN